MSESIFVSNKQYQNTMSVPADSTRSQADLSSNGVFEIGLCLAGAVSAGAYTSGVLDFLLEALEEWQRKKEEGHPDTPSHQVQLSVLASASAGSVVAALLACSLRQQFAHGPRSDNPLYRNWVEGVDILDLLGAQDLQVADAGFPSLLDCSRLDQLADEALAQVTPGTPYPRDHVADTLRLAFCQANLTGVPYALEMSGDASAPGSRGLDMTAHADHILFALNTRSDEAPAPLRPDEYALNVNAHSRERRGNWWWMLQHALGSSAFPGGLRHRLLERRASDYQYLFIPHGKYLIHQRPSRRLNGDYAYLCADGGTMNNEPVALTHQLLCGPLGHLEHHGVATRAMLLVDPFPDVAVYQAPKQAGDLFTALPKLLGAWKEQCRADSSESMLANDDHVYSRFLVSPNRGAAWRRQFPDRPQLASSSLGAFGGFLHQAYRHHDFMLGRRNCQQFLKQHFSLPAGHPLFRQNERQQARMTSDAGPQEWRIIPLLGSAAENQPVALPAWPANALDETRLERIHQGINARLRALITLKTLPSRNWGSCALSLLLVVLRALFGGLASNKALNAIKASQQSIGLLDPKQPPWPAQERADIRESSP